MARPIRRRNGDLHQDLVMLNRILRGILDDDKLPATLRKEVGVGINQAISAINKHAVLSVGERK